MGCSFVEEYKKSQYPYMLTPRGVLTAHQTQTKFGRAGNLSNFITQAKFQIDWNKIVPLAKCWISCFSSTEADAINTAKPCRAACDNATVPWTWSLARVDDINICLDDC